MTNGERSDVEEFDGAHVEDFIGQFYGYGTYKSKYWFIGKEEGGGTHPEVAKGLACWQRRGRTELEDLVEFHQCCGITEWFGEQPQIQPTWGRLIRVLYSAEGRPVTTDAVREFQASCLGRYSPIESNTSNCLLELLPLAVANSVGWKWNEWVPTLEYLRTAETYRNHVAPNRVSQLRARINRFKPKVVVFYSTDPWYFEKWTEIAGLVPTEENVAGRSVYFGRRDETAFVVTCHPTAFGTTNQYWDGVGQIIAQRFSS
jgi:hypothetical protein